MGEIFVSEYADLQHCSATETVNTETVSSTDSESVSETESSEPEAPAPTPAPLSPPVDDDDSTTTGEGPGVVVTPTDDASGMYVRCLTVQHDVLIALTGCRSVLFGRVCGECITVKMLRPLRKRKKLPAKCTIKNV